MSYLAHILRDFMVSDFSSTLLITQHNIKHMTTELRFYKQFDNLDKLARTIDIMITKINGFRYLYKCKINGEMDSMSKMIYYLDVTLEIDRDEIEIVFNYFNNEEIEQ